jgi:flagellar biosynthetic protein FliO
MSLNDRTKDVFKCLSVAGFNKKILVFLVTVILGADSLIVYSAQSQTAGVDSEKAQPDSNQPKAETESKNSPLLTNNPDFFGKSDYSPRGWEFSLRAVLAVLLVLALLIAALYVSKKYLPKIANLQGREIRVVETVHLGPRKAVHVLEVYNRRFLIGSTNENVTKLAELGSDLADLSAQEANYNGEDE